MENRIFILEEKVKALETDIKEKDKRINKIESDKQLQEFQYKTIIDGMQEIKQDVKEIKEKPSKNWGTMITSIISAVVGGIVAFISSKLL